MNKGRENFFITSFARTSHCHMSVSICRALGYRESTVIGIDGNGNEEQIINVHAAMILFRLGGQVFDVHVKATGNNMAFLKAYEKNINIVVVLRNVIDCLILMKKYFDRGGLVPGIVHPKDWNEGMEDHRKYHWLAMNALPWYTSFYVSWMQYDNALLVKHEDYESDKVASIRGILEWSGHLDDPALRNPRIKSLPKVVDHENPMSGLTLRGKMSDYVSDTFLGQVMDHFKSWGPYWEKRMIEDLR